MRIFFVNILLILGTFASFSQSLVPKIPNFSKRLMDDLCVEATFHDGAYRNYGYDTAFVVTGEGDTLYPNSTQDLTFTICGSDFGSLILHVDGKLIGLADIRPSLRLISVNDYLPSVRVPCDRSIPISDLDITKIIKNDYIECRFEGSSSVDTVHNISFENVDIIFDDSQYRDQIKIVNGNIFFMPDISDGRSSDVINYTLKHKQENLTSQASVTIYYEEINDIFTTIRVNGAGATAEVLGGQKPYTYRWNSSVETTDNIFANLLEGENVVEVTDALGCIDTLTFYQYKQIDFSYPEFFTPNGDGVNDRFELPELAKCRQYQVSIFNRSGLLLYSSVNSYEAWDGTYKGENLPSTDYWFVVTIHDTDEQIVGHFSLIR